MKMTALPNNLEYLLPEIQCYRANLRQQRIAALIASLPNTQSLPVKLPYRPTSSPTFLLPRQLRPFIVLSSTYRIN